MILGIRKNMGQIEFVPKFVPALSNKLIFYELSSLGHWDGTNLICPIYFFSVLVRRLGEMTLTYSFSCDNS